MEVGYKLIPTVLLRSLKLESNRFGFEPEVTAKILKLGIRIYEVPISYAARAVHDQRLPFGILGFETQVRSPQEAVRENRVEFAAEIG